MANNTIREKSGVMIYLLSLVGFFGIFSTTIAKSPVLPLFVDALHGNASVLGLISAISPLAGILFSFPVGLMSDRLGRKRLLVIAGLVFAAAPWLYLLVGNAYWLIPIRFFHGLATAILGPIASAIIVSAYDKTKGEKLGLYSSATLIGRTLAPLLGGMIIGYFSIVGWHNFRMVYVASGILGILTLLFILFLPRDGQANDSNKRRLTLGDFGHALLNIIRQGKISSTALVEMATYFAYGVVETYLPLYLHQAGVSAGAIGFIFSAQILSIALTKPVFGRLADRVDKRTQILVGIALLGLAGGLLPLFADYWLITAISILFGLGLSFSTVATSTYVAEVSAKDELGSVLGALSSIMDIGQSFGPLLVGIIITLSGFIWGFAAMTVVCLLSGLIFALVNFRRPVSIRN
jgi:MFS family permease